MVVYPRLLASAYATVRTLRDVLGCQLPIELWYRHDEMQSVHNGLVPLKKLADTSGEITFHEINDARAFGYGTKVYAVYHSFFERVLFLDADNVVRDPSFLFDSPEFVETGAVFWPDFWHPRRTLFNIHARSMLWEVLGLPFVDVFEQESGQLLVDRTRHAAPLELVCFYAFHEPNYFEQLQLVYGDKDLFRLAWLKLDVPYHMIESLSAMAGKAIDGSFCGMTMVQHDTQGDVLFLHRNQHKLTGEHEYRIGNAHSDGSASNMRSGEVTVGQPDSYPDPIIWTHLLPFRKDANRRFYLIDAYRATPQFPQWQPCYGRRFTEKQRHFELHEFSNLSFAGIKSDLRDFANEAANLRRANEPVHDGYVGE